MTEKLSSQLEEVSGTRGIFFTALPTEETSQMDSKQSDMTTEAYYIHARQLSEKTGKPLAIRQGGVADLGIIGAAPKDVPEPVASKVFGAKWHTTTLDTAGTRTFFGFRNLDRG